ncbi:MAG: hypothetical protein ACT4P3_14360 [Betaproteobacteria bacterium]
MFETETSRTEELRDDLPEAPRAASGWDRLATFCAGIFAGVLAALLPPVLALASLDEGAGSVFPPAPYFLLALGVGLFIGLALLAVSARHP